MSIIGLVQSRSNNLYIAEIHRLGTISVCCKKESYTDTERVSLHALLHSDDYVVRCGRSRSWKVVENGIPNLKPDASIHVFLNCRQFVLVHPYKLEN